MDRRLFATKSHVSINEDIVPAGILTDANSLYDARGTIVSNSNYSSLDNVAYGSGPPLTARDLIGNNSEVLDVAQLAIVSFPVSGGSAGLNSSLYLNISKAANMQLCSEGSDVAGAIMIHGTNTLEETVSTDELVSREGG